MPKGNATTRPSRRRPKRRSGKSGQAGKKNVNPISHFFDRFATLVTKWAGSPVAFGIALITVIVWAISGPAFGFSETWQLVINTGTTIITFLMVFLIQQSQNKDSEALHLKLDELLIAVQGADESLVDAELLDEQKLLALASALTARAKKQQRQRVRCRRRT